MLDYKKTVTALRRCAEAACDKCPYRDKYSPCAKCVDDLTKDAADAIEELLKRQEGQT